MMSSINFLLGKFSFQGRLKVTWKHLMSENPNANLTSSSHSLGTLIKVGQVDSTECAESAEFAKNYNYLSSYIKQPKNYLSVYSDTLSRILSIKNHPNFIFRQFRVFGYGSIRKNENAVSAESFRNFHSLHQWWIVFTVHSLIIWFILNTDSQNSSSKSPYIFALGLSL